MTPSPPPPHPCPRTFNSVTSRAPQDALIRLAKALNTTLDKLSTFTVSIVTDELYSAILEYASVASTVSPLHLVVPDHGRYEESLDEDELDELDEQNVSKSDATELVNTHVSQANGNQTTFEIRKKVGKMRASCPRFALGLGSAIIDWPPVPMFTANAVAEVRDQIMRKAHPSIRNTPKHVEKVTAASPNATQSNSTPDPSIKIALVHYAYGEPRACGCEEDFHSRKEVIVASTSSRVTLQAFAYQILQWKIDKDFRQAGLCKYQLYRLKTDRKRQVCWWHNEGLKRARPADSVMLSDGLMDSILGDVQGFLNPATRRWYVTNGLQHRRSYLLYGPPGTGKTSTIRVIASTFKMSCFFLNMTDKTFSNQLLGDALGRLKSNSLLVLEDVDALFNLDRKNDEAPSLTFSGLLNALDGVISVEGILTIMTTNHLERLDPALIRGGRVDRRFYFDIPKRAQVEDLFRNFYPDADPKIFKTFSTLVMERSSNTELRSLATLQQLFIHHRESTAEECLEGLPEFFRTHFPGDVNVAKTIYT